MGEETDAYMDFPYSNAFQDLQHNFPTETNFFPAFLVLIVSLLFLHTHLAFCTKYYNNFYSFKTR